MIWQQVMRQLPLTAHSLAVRVQARSVLATWVIEPHYGIPTRKEIGGHDPAAPDCERPRDYREANAMSIFVSLLVGTGALLSVGVILKRLATANPALRALLSHEGEPALVAARTPRCAPIFPARPGLRAGK